METQIPCPPPPPMSSVGKGSAKEQWTLPAILSKRKLPLQLSVYNSVPPCFSLVPPHPPLWLLPNTGTQQVSLGKSVWGPFQRNAWDFSNPVSHSATTLPYFHSQLSSQLQNPGMEAYCGVETPRFSGRTSAAQISLPAFSRHMWMWSLLLVHLYPSCQSPGGTSLFLVIGLRFCYISGGSE